MMPRRRKDMVSEQRGFGLVKILWTIYGTIYYGNQIIQNLYYGNQIRQNTKHKLSLKLIFLNLGYEYLSIALTYYTATTVIISNWYL